MISLLPLDSACPRHPTAGDVQPDEYDVAVCVDALERHTPFRPRRILDKWAGLRTFAPDREFVMGADKHFSSAFWIAGLGGYGIQTAMGNARVMAALAQGAPPPQDMLDSGLDASKIAPARLQ